MQKKIKKFPLFLSVLLAVLALVIVPVSADITLHFIDHSFLGDNSVTITGQDGSSLYNGTTTGTATIPADNFSASYWIGFEPGGYTDFAKHPEYAAKQTFEFGAEHAVGILVICFLGSVLLWRKYR